MRFDIAAGKGLSATPTVRYGRSSDLPPASSEELAELCQP